MNNANIKKMVILCSGEGSNLQAIIDYFNGHSDIQIACIISDKPSKSLERGIAHSIPTLYLPKLNRSRESYDQALMAHINLYQPDLIILAGFMRILSAKFIQSYPKQILNIHPSLLPKYKGLNTHKRTLENNDKMHGTTIHYVNEDLDGGEIIIQKSIKILESDNEKTLEEKVKAIEHQLYPKTIALLLSNKH